MKKNYKNLLLIVLLGVVGISANAQGTWTAIKPDPSPGATIAVGTELGFNITGLTVMNTAPEGVTQKSDAGAPVDGNFTNEGILQANTTNATFYAFKTASSGVLKVVCKLSASKPLFAYELTETNLATAAASGALIASGYGTAPVITLSDGSSFTEGMTFSATTYTTLTFNVSAGKVYAVGCTGSKLMLRGVNYTIVAGINTPNTNLKTFLFQNPAKGNLVLNMSETTQVCIYNSVGVIVKQQIVDQSNNTINISDLAHGIYIIKDVNNQYAAGKLVVD